jgi:hypothetical protein
MNFLKFLFLGNFLFVAFFAIILIRYYILSYNLFIFSGLIFFKFLLRLFIFNIFLYFIFNLGAISISTPSKSASHIVVISKDFKLNGINDNQIKMIINLVQKRESNLIYSLSVFDPLSDSLGVLIPQTNNKVFLDFIGHVDFKKWRPIYTLKYIPSNLSMIKIKGETIFLKSHNELIATETTKDNFLSIGENWFSINQLSLYLLILLLFLVVIDVSFKFQILK